MASHISHSHHRSGRPSSRSSLADRANVRGVRKGRRNRRRSKKESTGSSDAPGRLAVAGRVVGIVVAIGGIGYGGYALHRFAKTSPRFAIEDVVVKGHVRATAESIAKLSGARPGDNIFDVDVERMTRTVEAHPWVASAKVTRGYPHTVEIEVVEHEPKVLVALGHLYYADRDGNVVKRYAPGEEESLPVVTGLSREQIETDDGQARAQLRSAIDFLAALNRRYGEEAPEVSEVHLDPALGLSFVESGEKLTVVVGHPPYDEAIDRLARVKQALAEKNVDATRIVLGFERRRDRAVARLAKRATASRQDGEDRKGVKTTLLAWEGE